MNTVVRYEPFRGLSTLHDQVNRLFNETMFRGQGEDSAITTWAPAVDIFETPNELVVKADLPDVDEKDIDIRVENNLPHHPRRAQVREERVRGQLSSRRAHLRSVQPQLLLANDGKRGGDSRGIQERRPDRELAEARGVQAAPGEG